MKNLDTLIEQLKLAKEELSKNINMSYGSPPANGGNAMKGEGVTSRVGPLDSDKKDVGNGRMVQGDSPSPCDVDKKLMALMDKNENMQPQPIDHEKKKAPMQAQWPADPSGDFEKCSIAKNGQWSLEKDAADPKLAPKDVKVKALQQQIDAGTYKPDSKKIAGAMLKEEMSPEALDAKVHHTMSPGLKKSEETEELEKHAPYKIRERATKIAGRGPVLPKHHVEAKKQLDAEAAKKPKAAAAPAADHTKVEVSHISSYSAPGQGHEYQVTHHYRDGRTHTESRPQRRVNARVRNPNQTHTIHLKGHTEPIHTDEATAHAALKAGHFNLKAHLDKA